MGGRIKNIPHEAYVGLQEKRIVNEKESNKAYDDALEFVGKLIHKDRKIKKEERTILQAYIISGDIMERLAMLIGKDRSTIQKMTRSPKHKLFGEYFARIKAIHTAFVQGKLWDAVLRGEPWAIKSYLGTHSEEWNPKQSTTATFDDFMSAVERDITTVKK